ncbi:MAG: metalloregulator ArsR/SmtB family transcription factor [Thiotrichaceae bacterium]
MSKYSSDTDQRALMFKALGNPHRLAIFQQLTQCCMPGTLCSVEQALHFTVGQIGSNLDIAPSTVSHHLKELFRAGLIQTRRNGKTIECWIEPSLLDELSAFFSTDIDNLDTNK